MNLIDTYFNNFHKQRTKNIEEYFSEYFSQFPKLENKTFHFIEKCSFSLNRNERNIIMLGRDSVALISVEHTVTKQTVTRIFEKGFSFLIPDVSISLNDLASLFKHYYSGHINKKHKIKQVFFGLAGYTITVGAKRLADELGMFLFSRPQQTVQSENTTSFVPQAW